MKISLLNVEVGGQAECSGHVVFTCLASKKIGFYIIKQFLLSHIIASINHVRLIFKKGINCSKFIPLILKLQPNLKINKSWNILSKKVLEFTFNEKESSQEEIFKTLLQLFNYLNPENIHYCYISIGYLWGGSCGTYIELSKEGALSISNQTDWVEHNQEIVDVIQNILDSIGNKVKNVEIDLGEE